MDVSFSSFCQEIVTNPVLAITVLLTLGVIFVNGWTDAQMRLLLYVYLFESTSRDLDERCI